MSQLPSVKISEYLIPLVIETPASVPPVIVKFSGY
jgi:hypothetical protein